MRNINKSFQICLYNIRKWFANPRIYILALLLVIFVINYVGPISRFSKSVGYRVSPWIFPYISDYYFTQMLMMLGLIFLFCDAPFMDEGQTYFIIRSGRFTWGLGQVFYIMIGTACYFLFIIILSTLVIAPNMFFSLGWGKVMGTLAQTNAGLLYKIPLPISHQIQLLYSPIQAFLTSFFLEWCAGTMLGLIVFVVNINFSRAMGVIVASAVAMLDTVIFNALPFFMNHFSPVSMARLSILDPSGLSLRPTNVYSYIFFIIGIIILTAISLFSALKRDVIVLPTI